MKLLYRISWIFYSVGLPTSGPIDTTYVTTVYDVIRKYFIYKNHICSEMGDSIGIVRTILCIRRDLMDASGEKTLRPALSRNA